MLIILGGVQASGKSTILKSITNGEVSSGSHNGYVDLRRSKKMGNILELAPKNFGTLNGKGHLYILENILEEWSKSYRDSLYHSGKICLLDAGPITTLTYQVLALQNLADDYELLERFNKRQMARTDLVGFKPFSPTQMEELYQDALGMIEEHIFESFEPTVLGVHNTYAIHIVADPDIISSRFTERRNDIRSHNMQDHFRDKAHEISTYKRAYSRIHNWIGDNSNYNHFELDNNGELKTTLRNLEEILFG